MTSAKEEQTEEQSRGPRGKPSNFKRRPLLKALGVGAALSAGSGIAAASGDDDQDTENGGVGDDDNGEDDIQVDEPEGFEVEILAEHAPFPDEVSATSALTFTGTGGDDDGPPIGAHFHLDDESTMVVGEVTWKPGGTSGWHRHPGVVFVTMLEGEIEVTWERDCVPRTYSAGEGFFDPGVVHNADNVSEDENARAYAVFFGIPDGEPATIWVEPVEC